MGKSKTIWFSPAQVEAIEDLEDRGKADNASEAVRMLLNAGMQAHGYDVAANNSDTTLRRMAGELSRLFAYVGVAWIAFFWAFPVGFRLPGVLVMAAALGMVAIYVALGQVEPRVTHWLFSRGESA